MKKWLQKGLMSAVAVLTFGLITPDHEIWSVDASSKAPSYMPEIDSFMPNVSDISDVFLNETVELTTVDILKLAAREQAYIKFGSRIGPKIEGEFNERILPQIEQAIEMTVARLDDRTLNDLMITERPSGDYSERIFHIKRSSTKEDVIRFHVRTENRLNEGYIYNFHYHTFEDNFATHYELGEIQWSKNKPPKWMS